MPNITRIKNIILTTVLNANNSNLDPRIQGLMCLGYAITSDHGYFH